MWLIALHPGADIALPAPPRALKFRTVSRRVVADEKVRISADARGNEVLAGLLEYRPPLFAIGLQ